MTTDHRSRLHCHLANIDRSAPPHCALSFCPCLTRILMLMLCWLLCVRMAHALRTNERNIADRRYLAGEFAVEQSVEYWCSSLSVTSESAVCACSIRRLSSIFKCSNECSTVFVSFISENSVFRTFTSGRRENHKSRQHDSTIYSRLERASSLEFQCRLDCTSSGKTTTSHIATEHSR